MGVLYFKLFIVVNYCLIHFCKRLNPLLFSEKKVYLDRAKDCLINAINAAEHNGTITSFLPDFLLGYFDRIGRGLQEGEFIEFSPKDPIKKARLNKSTRRKLLLASKEQDLTEEITLRGRIPEADQDKMTFELQLLDGSRINAPIDNRYFSTVLEAFKGFKTGTLVVVKGIARYNRNNIMEKIESIESVNILDQNDITLQLNELKKIQDGWLDGKNGSALNIDLLDWFARFFDLNYPEDELPLPFLYPTPEGGIQAEWSINDNEITLEIKNVEHAQWHSLNMSTDQAEEKSLNLNENTDWDWMVSKIREMNSMVSHE